jgi:hypothetical protein
MLIIQLVGVRVINTYCQLATTNYQLPMTNYCSQLKIPAQP